MVARSICAALVCATAAITPACGGGGSGSSDGGTSGGSDESTGGEAPGDSGSTTQVGSDDSSSGGVVDDPGDPWETVPPYEPLDDESLAALGQTIDMLLLNPALVGAQVGVLVVDRETDQVLYERAPDDVLVPASNTKMFTTGAAMDIFGDDHRFATQVFGASPEGDGAVVGDLHLVGDHDFTWTGDFYDWASDRFPLDRLASRLWVAGVRSVGGNVTARGDFLYDAPSSLGTYDPAAHRAAAATNFRDALVAAGIAVGGTTATTPDFEPPAGTVMLAEWESPPLSVAAGPLNWRSHNEYADVLMRHVGFHQAGLSTYAAGGVEVADWMASIPTDTAAVAWLDGSGLSHGNRCSPRNLIDLLRHGTVSASGVRWGRTLGLSGIRGTVASRMTGADTFGRVHAKTGTLPSIGVSALSGYLQHRHDGRRTMFSMMENGATSTSAAKTVEDAVVGSFAVDLRQLGARPSTPVLLSAVGDDNSEVIELAWTESPDADGYVVWLSDDGLAWDRDAARYVTGTEHRAGQLELGPTVYVRVSALREAPGGPIESPPSDAYAAVSVPEPARIVIVDGNDRWQAQPSPENTLSSSHDFVVLVGDALERESFDTVANESLIAGDVALGDYDVVIWMLGEEGAEHLTFDDAERSIVAEYLDAGGSLFASGAEIGFDLVESGTPESAAFMTDTLRAGYGGDQSSSFLMLPTEPDAGVGALGFRTPLGMLVQFADVLEPAGGSVPLLGYVGGVGGTAAVVFEGDARVVVMGVPFESIESAADRRALMDAILARLG